MALQQPNPGPPRGTAVAGAGDEFIEDNFVSAADLTLALSRGIPELVHDARIARSLPPDALFNLHIVDKRDAWRAAREIVGILASPRAREAQLAVLAFIEDHPDLRFCIRPSLAESNEVAGTPAGGDEVSAMKTEGGLAAWDNFHENTYKSVDALVAALHYYRTELCNTNDISSQIHPRMVSEILLRSELNVLYNLVALASNPRREKLRQAILAFVKSKPDLWHLLKGFPDATEPIQYCSAATDAARSFYTYFREPDSFAGVISSYMTELILSRELAALIPRRRQAEFAYNDVKTAVDFTAFLIARSDPELFEATYSWMKQRRDLKYVLKPRS